MPDDETKSEETSPTQLEESGWKYSNNQTPQTGGQNDQAVGTPQQSVNWTASEYMAHEKDASWFIGLGIAGALIGALIFFATNHSIITTGIVLAMVVIFGVFAARKPEVLEYTIDNHGLKIGPKIYPYAHFKSFAIMDEGAVFSIMLLPLKRFMPSISIYYDSNDEKNIVEVLSDYLPLEQRDHDLTDRLMRQIRF